MDSVCHGLWKEKWGGVPSFIKEHVCANFSKNSEPLSTCLVWKIASTPLPVVDKNNHLSKQFLSLFYKWKALAHLKSLLPSVKGLSFTFMLSHHTFFEHLLESIVFILSVMCLSQNTVNCGITLMLISLIFLPLVFSWSSEVPRNLCFAPQIKASEIPLYHIYYEHCNRVNSYVSCCNIPRFYQILEWIFIYLFCGIDWNFRGI
jgi:hypothetical protein